MFSCHYTLLQLNIMQKHSITTSQNQDRSMRTANIQADLSTLFLPTLTLSLHFYPVFTDVLVSSKIFLSFSHHNIEISLIYITLYSNIQHITVDKYTFFQTFFFFLHVVNSVVIKGNVKNQHPKVSHKHSSTLLATIQLLGKMQ